MNIKPMSLCALVFASTICFSAPDPVNALPPKKQNKPPICSGSHDPFKAASGHDYRSNPVAHHIKDKKKILSELNRFQDPKKALEWLKKQPFLAPEDLQKIDAVLQGDQLIQLGSPCDEFDINEWLPGIIGPDIMKIPVLVAEFPDQAFPDTTSDVEAQLFGGSGSTTIQDYYEEVSYGQFVITGDVYGVYQVSSNYTDYPLSFSGAAQFARDVVIAADPYVDFSKYDYDGDGYVDAIAIDSPIFPTDPAYAGRAHQSYMTSYTTDDGVIARTYTMQDQYDSVGTYNHELGHVLGLPDQYAEGSRIGIGQWCRMANGSGHFCAWCKIELGWVTPKQVTGWVNDQEIRNAEDHKDIFQLAPGNMPLDEYFLVENRQKTGLDSSLPGDGLLIWHIGDGSGWLLEEADGLLEIYNGTSRGDAYDPFYDGNNTEFTPDTNPNSDYSDGTDSGVEATDISASGMTMTADLYNPTQVAGWTKLDAGVDTYLFDVAFADENTGWVVGYYGTIIHTIDGGATWTTQNSGTTQHLYSVQFTDANNGWTCGAAGTILHTSNGGNTWYSQTSSTTVTLRYLSFVDANYGWAIGNYSTNRVLLKTTNGGAIWSALTYPTNGVYAEDLKFLSTTEGYILGEQGDLLHTTDGGSTWTNTVITDEDGDGEGDGVTFGLYADSGKVWAVGEDGNIVYASGSTIIFTNDPDYSGNGNVDLFGNTGAIVGDKILMFDASTNVCNSTGCSDGFWYSIGLAFDQFIYAVDFVSDHVGYAVGEGGLILKYDAALTEYAPQSDWELTTGGEDSAGRDIVSDKTGNTLITGCYTGTEDFDPLGASGTTKTSLGGLDGYIAKYDGDGLLDWVQSFGSVNGDDLGRTIATDHEGNIYVAGCFENNFVFTVVLGIPVGFISNGGTDIFVAKLTPDGDLVWLRRVGGSGDDWAKGIALDASGNVYITGYFNNTVDFNPSSSSTYNVASAGNADGFLLKLNNSGSFVWVNRIGGTDGDAAFGVAAGANQVYVCGYHRSSTAYVGRYSDGTSVYVNNYGDADVFVTVYNQGSGTIVKATYMGGPDEDKAFDLALDNEENIYITGHYNDTAAFQTRTLIANGSASETFACKLDLWASVLWAKSTSQYGSSTDANGISTGRGIAVDPEGCNVYITGQYQGSVDFDPSGSTDWMYGPVCSYCECYKVFLWQLETDGSYIMAEEKGLDGENMGFAVHVNAQDAICVTGYFSEDVDCPAYDDDYGQIFIWKK